MAVVFRLVSAALVAVALLATTGVPSLASAAAQADCCDEDCDEPQCPEGSECPPLCTACVCGAYFAPVLLLAPDRFERAPTAVIDDSIATTQSPDDPPAQGVFHPPRPST